ncbi:tail fiber assembly protein [Variovorax sp. GB1P17]|uniref:tail fiber assembly protein n=1 Tax=Variovorax sp. GB1P17 TaxID=3443740 RepID=UPI003F48B998
MKIVKIDIIGLVLEVQDWLPDESNIYPPLPDGFSTMSSNGENAEVGGIVRNGTYFAAGVLDVALIARTERNRQLTANDWTQLPDVPTGVAAVWLAHRQALRDLPQKPNFPATISWPVAPA